MCIYALDIVLLLNFGVCKTNVKQQSFCHKGISIGQILFSIYEKFTEERNV